MKLRGGDNTPPLDFISDLLEMWIETADATCGAVLNADFISDLLEMWIETAINSFSLKSTLFHLRLVGDVD